MSKTFESSNKTFILTTRAQEELNLLGILKSENTAL